MGNPVKGIIDIAVGDRCVKLQFTTNAICDFEDEVGQSVSDFLAGLQAGGVRSMRRLLRAMMLTHQPEATLEDAGDLIDQMGGLAAASEKIEAAVLAAFPEAAKGTVPAGE